jgi:hypothetical protein
LDEIIDLFNTSKKIVKKMNNCQLFSTFKINALPLHPLIKLATYWRNNY